MVAARKLSTEISVTPVAPVEMALTVDAKGFKKILAVMNRVSDRKSTMPILAHVLISVAHGDLKHETTLTATDLNFWARYTMPEPLGARTGACAVRTKALTDVFGKMPTGELTMAASGHHLNVMAGSASVAVESLNARDYPKMPTCKATATFSTIDAGALASLLDSAIYSVCKDETRFHLNGIYLEADGKMVRAVSTDGHRLTRATAPIKDWTLVKGIILPVKASKEIARMLSKGECEIAVSEHFLFVKQGGWTFAAKLIDAQFPPYEQVIPKAQRKLVTVAREPLMAAIERSRLICSETRGVKLSCDDGQLRIQSDNPDTGETSEWLPAEHHGGTVVIGFNPAYLAEILAELDGERVTLGIGAELDPILVRATDDVITNSLDESPYVCVVMPMRI